MSPSTFRVPVHPCGGPSPASPSSASPFLFARPDSAALGLDLKGGTQIVLETRDSKRVKADAESTDRALAVLRGRVDALGVAEPTLARAGDRRIIVELPGVQDPREAAQVIGQTAQLAFHEVLWSRPADRSPAEREPHPLTRRASASCIVRSSSTATACNDARAEQPQNSLGQWVRQCRTSTGPGSAGSGGSWSSEPAATPGGRRIAILLDNLVMSAPSINSEIRDSGIIEGGGQGFKPKEVEHLINDPPGRAACRRA